MYLTPENLSVFIAECEKTLAANRAIIENNDRQMTQFHARMREAEREALDIALEPINRFINEVKQLGKS